METICGPLLPQLSSMFLDDIWILKRSTYFADHFADLRSVFSRLDAAACTLSVVKCQFGYDGIKLLGSEGRLSGRDGSRRSRRSDFPMIGFYRTHVQCFSVIAASLYARFGSKLTFHFILSESDLGRFEELKRWVTSPPVLSHPEVQRTFIIVVDAACK